jgi:hypothetical protein
MGLFFDFEVKNLLFHGMLNLGYRIFVMLSKHSTVKADQPRLIGYIMRHAGLDPASSPVSGFPRIDYGAGLSAGMTAYAPSRWKCNRSDSTNKIDNDLFPCLN